MEIDISPFVKSIKRRDFKGASDWLEAKKSELDLKEGFWSGYVWALGGMLSAIQTSQELSVIKRLVEGKPENGELEKLRREIKSRSSLKFRPDDEKGFDTAWLDFLESFSS